MFKGPSKGRREMKDAADEAQAVEHECNAVKDAFEAFERLRCLARRVTSKR